MSQLQAFLELRAQQRSGEVLFFVDFIEMFNFPSKAAGNQADHLEKYIRNTCFFIFILAFLVRVMSVKLLSLRKAWEAKECLCPAVANVAAGSQLLPGRNGVKTCTSDRIFGWIWP